MGSSSTYPDKISLGGVLARTKDQNQYFYNYTTIYVKYCDGTGNFLFIRIKGHQGYASDPIDVKGEKIWM